MRRGGVLILLIGLILIVGAVALFLLFGTGGGTTIIGSDGGPTVEVLPTEPPEVEVVRARIDIQSGVVISNSATLLEVVPIPENEFDPNVNFSRISDVEGQLTTTQIRAGEFIERDMLTEPGLSQRLPTAEPDRPRDKAYPLVVNNLSGVADQIKPGDFVDVVATYTVQRTVLSPSGPAITDPTTGQTTEAAQAQAELTFNTTKTIVQRVQVLDILRVEVPAEGTPEAGAVPPDSSSLPQVDEQGNPITPASGGAPSTITQGVWTLLLAVNDQEIELIEFSLSTNARIVLVLRGAGDETFEPTLGATFDLLVSEFGLPLPQPLPPRVLSPEEVLTPQPTRTPAPTRVP